MSRWTPAEAEPSAAAAGGEREREGGREAAAVAAPQRNRVSDLTRGEEEGPKGGSSPGWFVSANADFLLAISSARLFASIRLVSPTRSTRGSVSHDAVLRLFKMVLKRGRPRISV